MTQPKPTELTDCAQCDEFDKDTIELIQKIFSQDEIALLLLLAGASIKIQLMNLQKLPHNDMRRLSCQRDGDFAGAIAGKLMIGLEPKIREAIVKRIRKDHGISLQIKHQKCPHEKLPGIV